MAKAKRVHSTPRKTASKSKPANAPTSTLSADAERSRDLAYRRLEDRVNDLDRLCEITTDLVRQVCENPKDERAPVLAATIAEITQDRMRELRATYYRWYEQPLRDGDSYEPTPSYSKREAQQ